MRYILIDLSSDNHLQQPQIFGGYAGEHNETVLQVKLPKRMIGIECSGYRFDFQTSEDNKIFSPLIPVSKLNDNIISFNLVEQLTIAGKLLFNVVAILSDETSVSLISKTNTVVLYIEDSPDGNVQLINPNGYKDELQKMIDERISKNNPTGGNSGVYVGSGDMPEDCNVQIDPDGEVLSIDQTYNPKSKNAQSGKAVAEAVGNIRLHDFATQDSSAYIMEVLTPVNSTNRHIRSIRLLGDGKTSARNNDLREDEIYRPWNYGTKEDKINIEIGSGITEIRQGAFRNLKPTINKINFSNARSDLVIGENAFSFNDFDGELVLPPTFKIQPFAFSGNPCGIKWKSNYSAFVNEPILNSLETHINQRNEAYEHISFSNENVASKGCVLCQALMLLKNLTNAEVTMEDLVLLARNNAFVVNTAKSSTITNVTVDEDKILSLSLTGKEAKNVNTSTVADRKYYEVRFDFVVNDDKNTFTASKYLRDTKENIILTSSLSIADLQSVYGVSFEGSLTVGDLIIIGVYPYEALSGGTNTDFIKFVADRYNLSCTVLERPINLQQHNEFLLSQISKDVYITDSAGGHHLSIRGCDENGDVYVIDSEDKTLNRHTQDLQYVFAKMLPETVDEFSLNTFKVMHRVHYKNLFQPRTDRTSYYPYKGTYHRITADGTFEIYGQINDSTNYVDMRVYDSNSTIIFKEGKEYSAFNATNISIMLSTVDIVGGTDDVFVFRPKQDLTIEQLGLRFRVTKGTNYGTEDNPTRYNFMIAEGNYLENGLTYFPYED